MHKNEIDIRDELVYRELYEEALHIGAKHVEALEIQRDRQRPCPVTDINIMQELESFKGA